MILTRVAQVYNLSPQYILTECLNTLSLWYKGFISRNLLPLHNVIYYEFVCKLLVKLGGAELAHYLNRGSSWGRLGKEPAVRVKGVDYSDITTKNNETWPELFIPLLPSYSGVTIVQIYVVDMLSVYSENAILYLCGPLWCIPVLLGSKHAFLALYYLIVQNSHIVEKYTILKWLGLLFYALGVSLSICMSPAPKYILFNILLSWIAHVLKNVCVPYDEQAQYRTSIIIVLTYWSIPLEVAPTLYKLLADVGILWAMGSMILISSTDLLSERYKRLAPGRQAFAGCISAVMGSLLIVVPLLLPLHITQINGYQNIIVGLLVFFMHLAGACILATTTIASELRSDSGYASLELQGFIDGNSNNLSLKELNTPSKNRYGRSVSVSYFPDEGYGDRTSRSFIDDIQGVNASKVLNYVEYTEGMKIQLGPMANKLNLK